jgi:8-oxo-dGTP diphosphatase
MQNSKLVKIREYKKGVNLRERTLLFIVQDKKILLGKKKSGFGLGKILGIGGKIDGNETPEETIIRESMEEINVVPVNIKKVAVVNFYFPYVEKPDAWEQKVHVFLTDEWQGKIEETDEILPLWFKIKNIPFDEMWPDAKYWLPKVLNGEKIEGHFIYNDKIEIYDSILKNS